MKTSAASTTDLVLNPDGSVYHLHLKAEDIADIIILVGDQGRVSQVSRIFHEIEFEKANREFVTHTGFYNGQRISALSTGIGTDNIDIVLNELYAAIHFDPITREQRSSHRKLQLIRIGTSGALQAEDKPGSFLASAFGLGLDGLVHYYNYPNSKTEKALLHNFQKQVHWLDKLAEPYFTTASKQLLELVAHDMKKGITVGGTGFYGPQGRKLGGFGKVDVEELLSNVDMNGVKVTNFDMETSALYGLGKMFGFDCLTVNAIIANRPKHEFLEDYNSVIDKLIKLVLNRVTAN